MTKKELQEYYWTKRNIQKLENRLVELESYASKQTSRIKNDADARFGSGHNDRLGDVLAEMADLRREIENEIQRSYTIQRKIEKAVISLPEREKFLIRARYIDRMSWEQIAVDMNFAWAQVHRIHAKALKLLA